MTMLMVYTFVFVLGGILLVASIVMGGHDDAELDADTDFEAEADGGVDDAGEHELDGDAHGDLGGFFTAFVSLRFWTFFFTFFGLGGLLLSWLQLLPSPLVIAIAASGAGFVIAYFAVSVFRRLNQTELGSVPEKDAYIGKTGRILLPVTSKSNGKIRIELDGRTVDVLATSDDEEAFEVGNQALIIGMNGPVAVLSSFKSASKKEIQA